VEQALSNLSPYAEKFEDPYITADGNRRACVEFEALETLWFNTGTLCNIECRNCYIESSPKNDRLAYLSADDVSHFLDQVAARDCKTLEIAFTGGEPFLNPEFPKMLEESLGRGYRTLVLTNAMRPMMRPLVCDRLEHLRQAHGNLLELRVSLDHYTCEGHEAQRGAGSWEAVLEGLRWLSMGGFHISVAGRTLAGKPKDTVRSGYARLFAEESIPVDAADPAQLVLFPEMEGDADPPEITVDCWKILDVDPSAMMCARSRMIVKRRGAARPTVVSCTLLPYDQRFEMGDRLSDSFRTVRLNHPYCASFCVLGGGACSIGST
jgi:uncharacterized Fe-S cluster-containing radical SAM superfamily protein